MSRRPKRPDLIVVGGRADGHAGVVVRLALEQGFRVLGFVSDPPHADTIEDVPWIGPVTGAPWSALAARGRATRFHVAIGQNLGRYRILREILDTPDWPSATPRLQTVLAADHAGDWGEYVNAAGWFLGRMSMVDRSAVPMLGHGVLLNDFAVVEHDCIVGECAQLGPAAVLCGRVHLGARAFIGANATVLPDVSIGDDAAIGAGAVVREDVPDGETWAGVPARRIIRASDSAALDRAPPSPDSRRPEAR